MAGNGPAAESPRAPSTEDRMAKQRPRGAERAPRAVSAERSARLYRLLHLLRGRPQSRAALTRRLHLDIRGFYRDLELLRAAGIAVALRDQRYVLGESLPKAV